MASGRSNSLETEICIAGAGPAGLALASALASAGRNVVLLESGTGNGNEPDALDDGDVSGPSFNPLTSSRRRGLGGTALSWNSWLHMQSAARFVPLDAWDFDARPWIPHSGWPIAAADLAPHYARARAFAGLGGEAPADAYLVGLASHFTASLPSALSANPLVRILTDATVTRLDFVPKRSHLRALRWSGRDGASGEIRAARFVLALGAIENARQLLLAELPNEWLGRGYMEHPRDRTLRLTRPTRFWTRAEPFFRITPGGATWGTWGRVVLPEGALKGERLLNASATVYALPGAGSRLRGPLRRLLRRPRASAYGITINMEQAPDRENRVTLSSRRDRFDRPLPRLDWQWTRADEASRVRVRAIIRETLEAARYGRIETVEQAVPDPNAHHHAGMTRMSANPADGVVDANCRVHGVDNLYLAGASVFPTAGYANPTLTIVALSLRLADHLDGKTE